MFLAIRKFSGIKNPDTVLKKIETELVPQIRELPGFIAYYAMKFDDGSYGPVGVFETKANLDNALEHGRNWLKNNLPDSFPNEPETFKGEVLFSVAGKTIARSA